MDALVNIPSGVTSTETPLFAAKYGFIVGIGSFVFFFFMCRSNGSNWGIGSARKAISIIRAVIFFEVLCLCVLLSLYIKFGVPISLHSALRFPNGENWIYGFPRPVAGILLIGCGVFADTHPMIRYVCCIGCFVQMLGDTISSYQIYDYKHQIQNFSAPTNGYTIQALEIYYWRDIVSIALSTCTLFLVAYLISMLGFWLPQLIHPSVISGKFYNRFEVMQNGRSKRKFMEHKDIIFSPPPPLVPRKTLQMKIEEQFHQRQKSIEISENSNRENGAMVQPYDGTSDPQQIV